MIEYVHGDVLNSGEEIVVHGCNCFNSMGAGIAAQVREQYPEAWLADQRTVQGDVLKLGTYTTGTGKNGTIIINAYTQYGYFRDKPAADYTAIENVMRRICEDYPTKKVIAMPRIGAGLAGGDWNVIESILAKVSDEYDRVFRVYIYDTQPQYQPSNKKDIIEKWRQLNSKEWRKDV